LAAVQLQLLAFSRGSGIASKKHFYSGSEFENEKRIPLDEAR